ncbi:DUF3592 domain-containing protein [Mycobacterium sp. CBMA293]|uniref:DUF3592 domain-containing protein n=1 Tax=unclassified Mycolicibacterium TaxID=2636767 RepID=UPI0012DF897D|nr:MULTISPECIES: DUF3592 domain-containing protein [unclassified Mycolicibacterium]MUL47547.1 DUF3592 domain-containing protein [Mycolicibacterium sp. CBMA 360]MUL59536.1 DUF3592 domain-containing protein [Mycolicibacterium sp. CBMA 335]MUL71261.1 DUF3592 domain-containing protein [Mycolicibacterium sp. CBMA 311]MUL94904.1 DUF3592 domain-containing protein [Mycolicibacterium sp. CBMA 230]MUM03743.1 hypothetical protein [Mycolicibacterium sp. CBMA 213]
MRIEYVVALIAAIVIVDVVILVALLRKKRARRTSPGTTAATGTELGTKPQPKTSAAPVLARVFLTLGVSLAIAAGFCAVFVAHDNTGDSHADGTVVELVPSGRGSSPRYRARVEFTTEAGAQIRFLSPVSSNPPPANVGEHVDIRYDANNPHDAQINTYWQVWFLPTLIGIISAPFLLVGGGFGIVSRASSKHGPEIA